MKYDVFVSHSSKDRVVATKLVEYFESRDLKCFISSRDIPHCDNWAEILVKALEESRMVVYLHTATANVSEQVTREIQIAVDNLKLPLITYRLTDDPFLGAKKFFIQSLNWIDSLVDPEENFGLLYDSVQETLAGREAATAEQQTKGLFFKRHKKTIISLVAAAVLLAGGYILYDMNMQKKQEALDKAVSDYAVAVERLDNLLADTDSLAAVFPCIDAAEAISAAFDAEKYGSLFTPSASELREKATATLNQLFDQSCQKIRSYYEGYKVVKSDNIKAVITDLINTVSAIDDILPAETPEDVVVIKNALL